MKRESKLSYEENILTLGNEEIVISGDTIYLLNGGENIELTSKLAIECKEVLGAAFLSIKEKVINEHLRE